MLRTDAPRTPFQGLPSVSDAGLLQTPGRGGVALRQIELPRRQRFRSAIEIFYRQAAQVYTCPGFQQGCLHSRKAGIDLTLKVDNIDRQIATLS